MFRPLKTSPTPWVDPLRLEALVILKGRQPGHGRALGAPVGQPFLGAWDQAIFGRSWRCSGRVGPRKIAWKTDVGVVLSHGKIMAKTEWFVLKQIGIGNN